MSLTAAKSISDTAPAPSTTAPAAAAAPSAPAAPNAVPSAAGGDTAPPKPPEAPKAPELDPSRELALIHRERKRLKEQERANAERLKKLDDFEQRSAKAKEDPVAFLATFGLSLDDLIKRQLTAGEPPSTEDRVKTIEERLAEQAKKEQDAKDQAEREAEQKRTREEVDAFRGSVSTAISSNPEQYELLTAEGDEGIEFVMAVCAQAIAEDPDSYPTRADAEKLLPRVLGMLEDQLLEQEKARHERRKGLKKLQSLFGTAPKPEEPPKDTSKPEATVIPAPQTTLTNQTTVSPAAPETPGRLLSRDESIKQLAAKLDAAWRSPSK